MLYKQPFVLYLNISVCIILLFLTLPSLLNRREEIKIRLAFSLIFFTVIANCTTNVFIILFENYAMVPVVFMLFFVPLLFGPAVYYYVKSLLGSKVRNDIYISLIPGIASFGYGVYLIFEEKHVKQNVLDLIIAGEHAIFNYINLLTLIYIMLYCTKAWRFLNQLRLDRNDMLYQQSRLKKAWAKEFTLYIFAPVFIFSIAHAMVLGRSINISTMDMDLIWMPVFMLLVYLLIAIRSVMMYKEFEYQFVLAQQENDKQIQNQRLDIARDLHDSLGAHLTFIASVSDGLKKNSYGFDNAVKNKVGLLSEFTENSIMELKNSLWILSSNDIKLEDVRDKISNFVRSAGEATDAFELHFKFEMHDNLTINSKLALDLLRTVQEIINNAAKYSQATDLWVQAEQFSNTLHLTIRDNGVGFDVNEVKSKSLGLSSLHQRVHRMGGNLVIDSGKGKGTTYLIQITLNEHNSHS